MKESYKEDLANQFGLELYADGDNAMGLATTEGYAGKLLSSEIRRPDSFGPNETAPVRLHLRAAGRRNQPAQAA